MKSTIKALDTVIQHPTKVPMMFGDQPLTVRLALVEACGSTHQDHDRNRTGAQAMELYALAMKIQQAGDDVELTSKQIAKLQDRVVWTFPAPFISAPLQRILSGKSINPADDEKADQGGEATAE